MAKVKKLTRLSFKAVGGKVRKVLSPADKVYLHKLHKNGWSVANLATKYKVSRKYIYLYLKQVNENNLESKDPGRNQILSDNQALVLRGMVDAACESSYQMKQKEFKAAAIMCIKESYIERNIGISDSYEPDPKTLNTIIERIGCKGMVGESTTNCRFKAVEDFRNFVSYAAVNHFVINEMKVPNELILSLDATQYKMGHDNQDEDIMVIVPKQFFGTAKVLPDESEVGHIAYFIKLFLLISAGCKQADPVYVIADNSMDPEEIVVYNLNGFGTGTKVYEGNAWLIICKTRVGNLKLFQWINTNIIIPFVKELRKYYSFPQDTWACLQLDGEAAQIECYKNSKMIKILVDNHIIIEKLPGSTTHVLQALDFGNCFRSSKTNVKGVSDDFVLKTRLPKINKLKIILEEYYNSHKIEDVMPLQKAYRDMAAIGITRIHYALQKSANIKVIEDSFAGIGIYPFNISVILNKCTATITNDQQQYIIDNISQFSDQVNLYGEVPDAFMDLHPLIPKTKGKDNFVVGRRRSVLLTHPIIVENNA